MFVEQPSIKPIEGDGCMASHDIRNDISLNRKAKAYRRESEQAANLNTRITT